MSREQSFENWYVRALPRVLAAVQVACGASQAEAQDAASEAFARAFVRWRRVSKMDSPDRWAARVAINHARRSSGRRWPLTTDDGSDVADSEPAGPDLDLWSAVAGLSLRQRTAIVLRYIDDLSQAQIAEDMGLAPGTVAATLHQARSRLRSELNREEALNE